MRKLLIIALIMISTLCEGQSGWLNYSGAKNYAMWTTKWLQADNTFYWKGDTIKKEFLGYFDLRSDSLRMKYIGGSWSPWYYAGRGAYVLPVASASTLGGIKVGSGLSITNGVLSSTGGDLSGYVPYSGATNSLNLGLNNFTVDNNLLVVDAANKKIGIGTNVSLSQLTQKTTIAMESAPLGSELLNSSGWTSVNWTGDYSIGFTHQTGNTTAISRTTTTSASTRYQISFTVTGRTAGSFKVAISGYDYGGGGSGFTSSGTWGILTTTSNSNIVFTPTTDFNGTISNISLKQITGTSNPVYGVLDSSDGNTLQIRTSTTSLNNLFIGENSGRYNTTGINNLAIGSNSMQSNLTGSYNLGVGANSLPNSTFGYNNTGIGGNSLYSTTIGSYNVAIGSNSLYANTTGSNNIAVGGYGQLNACTTGGWNIAIGGYALSSLTTSGNNTAIGGLALRYITGSNNTALGYNAGTYTFDGTTQNITSGNSVYLGYGSKSSASGNANEIVIGYNAIGNGSNTATLGNSSIIRTYLTGINLKAGTATSGTAPLKFSSGVVLTTPETGAVEFDGTDLFFTSSTRQKFIFNNDSRLTDSRPASDVYGWAKALTKPDYTWTEITNKPTFGTTTNDHILKFDTGTTEGTDLYTFNGSAAKTVDIKAGQNITLSKSAGSITISAAGNNDVDTPQVLTGTSPVWNYAAGKNATIVLTGNTTITMQNIPPGKSGSLTVKNASTAYTLNVTGYTNAIGKAIGTIGNYTKINVTGASKLDKFSFSYDGTYLFWNGNLDYITAP